MLLLPSLGIASIATIAVVSTICNSAIDDETVTNVEDGKVTAVVVGETTIIVTPSIVHVNRVIISRDKASLEVGKSDTLTATVLSEDAVDKNVSWFSNNIDTVNIFIIY